MRRDPVYDLAWLQSKTGSEAMTVSSDGRVLWCAPLCGQWQLAVLISAGPCCCAGKNHMH